MAHDLPSAARDGASGSVQARLEREIGRLLGGAPDEKRLRTVGKGLAALHALFTSELPTDEPFPDYAADRTTLAAYLAWFFPASVQQVARALAECPMPPADTLRVLDAGSGPGPASLAAAAWARTAGRRVEATALDASQAALEAMTRLWSARDGVLATERWRAGEALPQGPFDLVVASHLLNEAFHAGPSPLQHRVHLAAALAALLSPQGILLLVEPALRRTGRELLVVRDRLVESGLVAIAPCIYQGACPAIRRPRDWCHADRPWPLPPLAERAGRAAGIARDSLKFAYVALSKTHPHPERARDGALFRVVSEPLPEKGKLRYFGCGPAGRHALTRLDRDVSPANAAFAALERGDVVRLGPTTLAGDGRRVGPDTEVRREIAAADRDADASL